MLATVVLAAAAAGQPLVLAPGQESLYRAHVADFPKAGWAVAEGGAPVSSSPQLGGRMLDLLPAGTPVEVAGLGTAVPRPERNGALDEVFAVPVQDDPQRPAGFVQARNLAVLETMLGRCGPGGFLFTTVLGSEMVTGVEGLVLTLAVWVKRDDGTPERVLQGANRPPGLEVLFPPDGGAAVTLDGAVALLSPAGRVSWRSPAGQTWSVVGNEGGGVAVAGPAGRLVLRP